MNILPKIVKTDDAAQLKQMDDKIMRRHAEIGSSVFGPVPKGHQRQFFCMDEYTWIWYESWKDQNGQDQSVTTRYDVRPNAIYKIQNEGNYQTLSDKEATNLYQAARLYIQRVVEDYNARVQAITS
jgi:hypothetical protein